MSGALEIAAGAFAVVGAADVAVRTGREVYGFLRNLVDAPDDINRLCDLIRDTTMLAETSKQCLERLSKPKSLANTYGAISSLDVSLRGINRELQSLRLLSSRFKGTTKTWGRVRYVLDERKTGKALENLERSKVLLGNALILACRELSAIDLLHTESLIRHCYEEHGLQIHTLAEALSTQLDDHRHELDFTLKEQHQQTLQKHKTHSKAFSSVHRSHAKILSRQACLVRSSTHIHKQTANISRNLTETQRIVTKEHQKTREILSADFENIISNKIEALSKPSAKRYKTAFSPNRDIHFFGERRDMIMAYLLLVKSHIEAIIQHIMAHAGGELSLQDIARLQYEFEHLIASAAQEEAASHFASTSTSLDQWFYSEDIARSSDRARKRTSKSPNDGTNAASVKEEAYTYLHAHRRLESTQQSFSHDTPFGNLRIHVPRQAGTPKVRQVSDEVGFSFTCGIGQSIHAISARFLRDLSNGRSPKLYTQLNVFTVSESDERYNDLFATGTIEEIDAALRQGVISPYHINREGRNMCLYFAAENARTDLFDYLESQGIGVSALNHDFSVVAGLFKRSMSNDGRLKLEASVDHVLEKVYDSSSFLFETAMNMLLWDYYKGRPRSLLKEHLHRLEKENLIPNPTSSTIDDSPWDWESVSRTIRPLMGSGAYVDSTGSLGRNRIQRCFSVLALDDSPGDPKAVEEIANALIGAGVDIHHRDNDGLTPSMYARKHGRWSEWLIALERNGKFIEDVVREEKSEWLLEENWQETWKQKYARS
ncbi:uncharacterized protein K460DRAFT_134979 [Cucurbitaria berberidis CBS 394.84]|uniref:Fungal N-terminal domain-containing protein n=1 Tax=Cucurbitaria berberidis CBS 394.84 TaxID=1168544 RepID=A0A9P4L618_9PLEO|nr:uncharacterized protein K460DRAFT_134979 [Cucurbitaria berberidis CBS 394.84]KAF1842839.1 hypothetical protein K460DRAFT_134979 [Cucurbitaria berberidis CBS 394.84]